MSFVSLLKISQMKIIVVTSLILLILFIVNGFFRKKNQANKIIFIDQTKCTRCRVCLRKCRHDVLGIVNDKNGVHIEIQNPDNCTACNDCVRACRFQALSLVDKNIK